MTSRSIPRFILPTVAALCVTIASCGSDDDATTATTAAAPSSTAESTSSSATAEPGTDTTVADTEPASTTAASTDTAPAATAFPVTVEHAFGETTIDAEPQRVVSIGFTDHDVLLALGVEPVAIRQWYGDYEYVWPWAQEALGDQTPVVLPSSDLNFEQIAELDPDLIIGLYISLDDDQYATLSEIAPTVAQPADYAAFGAPWQVMTEMAGAAVGRSESAAELIERTEGLFAEARAANPDFEGVELAYAGVYGSDGLNFYVETQGSTRMAVLEDLGFVVPEQLASLGDDSFYHDISAEQLDLLETDVVLWEPATLELLPEVEANPIYNQLAVAQDDRDVFITDPVTAGAMAHADVLSLPYVLDALVPELSRAVGNLND